MPVPIRLDEPRDDGGAESAARPATSLEAVAPDAADARTVALLARRERSARYADAERRLLQARVAGTTRDFESRPAALPAAALEALAREIDAGTTESGGRT